MSTTTVTTALQRITRLIPVSAAGSSHLTGQAAYVCTPAGTLPQRFRHDQRDRTEHYLTVHDGPTGGRVPTGELATRAPRYVVTSYGVPIAWVTMDGRTHYATDADSMAAGGIWREHTTRLRHREAIRASWPERFALNGEGDPIMIRQADGTHVFAPAGSREVIDDEGHVHVETPDAATV